MELQETQEREIELKQVEALEMINEMLSEYDQPPLKLSWIKNGGTNLNDFRCSNYHRYNLP